MKNLLRVATILSGLVMGAACDREPAPPASPSASSAVGQVKPYPLKTCIVSDEPLGSMGEPVVLVQQSQEVKFCCDGCTGPFKKDPARYLAKLASVHESGPSHDHGGPDQAGHDHAP